MSNSNSQKILMQPLSPPNCAHRRFQSTNYDRFNNSKDFNNLHRSNTAKQKTNYLRSGANNSTTVQKQNDLVIRNKMLQQDNKKLRSEIKSLSILIQQISTLIQNSKTIRDYDSKILSKQENLLQVLQPQLEERKEDEQEQFYKEIESLSEKLNKSKVQIQKKQAQQIQKISQFYQSTLNNSFQKKSKLIPLLHQQIRGIIERINEVDNQKKKMIAEKEKEKSIIKSKIKKLKQDINHISQNILKDQSKIVQLKRSVFINQLQHENRVNKQSQDNQNQEIIEISVDQTQCTSIEIKSESESFNVSRNMTKSPSVRTIILF